MQEKTVKIEEIFKKSEQLFKKTINNRFLLYKIAGVLIAVSAVGAGIWFFMNKNNTEIAEAGWYQDSWTRRMKITINKTYTQGDLTNFPVLISTTTTNISSYARTDGRDIIFTDARGEKLNHEIEKYNASTGELLAWAKVPYVASSTDTILYMYYGNSGASDQQNPAGIWDSNYKLIEHFGGDISSSANTVTFNGDADMNATTKKFGSGSVYFDGSGDYLSIPDSDDFAFGTGNFTIDFWMKLSSTAVDTPTVFAQYPHDNNSIYLLYYGDVNGNRLRFGGRGGGMSVSLDLYSPVDSIEDTDWHHIAYVRNGSSISCFIDGTSVENVGTDIGEDTMPSISDPFWFGAIHYGGPRYFFYGYIDEVRISKGIARWTSNFTPPTSAYGADSYTKLLLHMDSDNSASDLTATAYGDGDWVSAGKIGGAFNFDGTEDYLTIPDVSFNGAVSSLTLTGWIYPGADSQNGKGLFGDYDNNTGSALWLYQNGKANYLLNNTYSLTGGATISTAGWTYVALVWDGSNYTTYVNGTPDLTGAFSGLTDGTNFNFGAYATPGTAFYTGKMDEVRFLNTVRSVEWIRTEYNNQNSPSTFLTWNAPETGGGPVAYWRFDEGYASTTYDGVGNNHGTLAGNTTWTTSGKFGNALSFDGSGDYLSVVDNGNFDFGTGDFAIQFWIKRNGAQTNGDRIYYSSNPGVAGGFMIYFAADPYSIYMQYNDGENHWIGNVPTSDGVWAHIVIERDGNTMKFYKDGVHLSALNADVSGASFNNADSNIYIMGNGNEPAGDIDEFKIYNRALSASEIVEAYSASGGSGGAGLSISKDAREGADPIGWWRFEEQAGTTANDASGNFFNGAITGATWATAGKVGNAFRFDGNDYITVLDKPALDFTTAMSFSIWVKWNSFTSPATINWPFSKGLYDDTLSYTLRVDASGNNGLYYFYIGEGPGDILQRSGGATLVTNTWYHIAGTYAASTNIHLYLNGVLDDGATSGNVASVINSSQNLYIGTWEHETGGLGYLSRYTNGYIDELKFYNYARDQRQIMLDYNGGGPVGYWKFDEGYASTTYDGSGRGNTATLAASGQSPSWTLNGKFGNALTFDGTNDYVSAVDSTSLRSISTVSFWVKPTSTINSSSAEYEVVSKRLNSGNYDGFTSGFYPTGDSNGGKFYVLNDPGAAGNSTFYSTTNSWAGGTWHHIAYTADGTNLNIYVNGVKETSGSFTTSLTDAAATFFIGVLYTGTNYFFPGQIDEVKIYNYARTPEEIREDYLAGGGATGKGAAIKLGSKRNEGSTWDDGGFGGAAPIGYWRFEEQTGTTANDASGNLNTGTITGATWATVGKVGGAMRFDGSGDYVDMGDPANLQITGDLTLEAWVKPSVAEYAPIMCRAINADTPLDYILYYYSDNTFAFALGDGASSPADTVSSAAYPTGSWYHIVGTISGTTMNIYVNGVASAPVAYTGTRQNTAYNFRVGALSNGTYDFNGQIDEVKIYNYARSAAQIAYDFNGGKPVGHWKFDRGEGPTAYDASGNGNNGTLYPGTSGSTTATSSMWTANGKINNALSFDGTDDYVSFGDNSIFSSTNKTIMFWMKMNSYGDGDRDLFLGKASEYVIGYDYTDAGCAADKLSFALYDGDWICANSNTQPALNIWHHVAASYDGTNMRIYINGVLDGGPTAQGAASDTANVLWVGDLASSPGYSPIDGFIDDVRIYNYARTPDQIKGDMNNGAGVRL
ncbi:MAG: DUF2341 domain-containing protein [Patescibacteria group bacterium]|jgi:hypothetical protein